MPKFIQLKNEFQENGNIIFLTVSIDQERTRDKWLKAIQENNMTGLINLIISPTGDSHFETDYQIVGVPRYFIIDKYANNEMNNQTKCFLEFQQI